jgi:hypothetical protein
MKIFFVLQHEGEALISSSTTTTFGSSKDTTETRPARAESISSLLTPMFTNPSSVNVPSQSKSQPPLSPPLPTSKNQPSTLKEPSTSSPTKDTPKIPTSQSNNNTLNSPSSSVNPKPQTSPNPTVPSQSNVPGTDKKSQTNVTTTLSSSPPTIITTTVSNSPSLHRQERRLNLKDTLTASQETSPHHTPTEAHSISRNLSDGDKFSPTAGTSSRSIQRTLSDGGNNEVNTSTLGDRKEDSSVTTGEFTAPRRRKKMIREHSPVAIQRVKAKDLNKIPDFAELHDSSLGIERTEERN